MGSEDVGGVVEEVTHGNEAGVGYLFELEVGHFSLGRQVDVKPGSPDLIIEDLEPLLLLLILVVEE